MSIGRMGTVLVAAVVVGGCGDGAPMDGGAVEQGTLADAAGASDGGVDQGGLTDAHLPSDDAASPPGDLAISLSDARPTLSGTFLFTLDAGAFPPTPAHPSALVYFPAGFDPTPPLSVVVYLHGWDNCVENVVRDAGASCNADAGTPVRSAYALAAQLDASRKNALLLCPEAAFDQPTGNPGGLGRAGGFRALLDETLRDLAPQLGARTSADVAHLVVASHSGGYQAAAALATVGGVPVDELYLLDSLYGNTADFTAWMKKDLHSFHGAPATRRFADVYTTSGGTLGNSQQLAIAAAGWFPADAGVLVDDRTTATWPPPTYQHGLLFKHSALPHDGIPTYYFGHW